MLWLQLAQSFARTPSGRSEKVARLVFALIAGLTLPLGLLVLFSDLSTLVTAEEAKKVHILGYVLLGLGGLMVSLALHQSRALKRARALQHSLLRKAGESSGRVVNSLDVAHWLGRHWHGDYPQASLMSHANIFQVIIESSVASVLIDFTPRGFMTGSSPNHHGHWWARVLVAVERPFHGDTAIRNQPSLQWIEGQGYKVQCEAGCLSARGEANLEAKFNKDPASVHAIFEVANELANVALAMRAV